MTPPMPVRLLIADVDETLLTDGKVLTEAASDAVGEQRGQELSWPSSAAGHPLACACWPNLGR